VVLLVALSRRDRSSSSSCSDAHDVHDQLLSFASADLPLPAITEGEAPGEDQEGPVFEDKQAVHVTPARPAPRRSRSEKVGRGRRTRAASPELRRLESERCRRRRSLSSASPGDWGAVDEEVEFRSAVEAFIAKQQTRFHREESSFVLVAGAGDEITAAAAAAAVAPVK
uniref:Uncharacterized protein n=2 Tax=Oryza brachyantha TaxID=4533 RepID=J3L255_ORYBR